MVSGGIARRLATGDVCGLTSSVNAQTSDCSLRQTVMASRQVCQRHQLTEWRSHVNNAIDHGGCRATTCGTRAS